MSFLRYFYIVFFINFTVSGCLAVDFTELRAQRDELIANRDPEPSSEYYDALYAILQKAVGAHTMEVVQARVYDPNHFANEEPNIARRVLDEVVTLKQKNSALLFSTDQVLVVDFSRILDLRIHQAFAEISSCGVTTKKILKMSNKKRDAAQIILEWWKDRYPNTSYLLMFNSYIFSTWPSLRAALRHELAHLTQSNWQEGKKSDFNTQRQMEIDADFKAVCERGECGNWHLSEDYDDVIKGLSELFRCQVDYLDKAIDDLCRGLNKDEEKRIRYELNRLYMAYLCNVHPSIRFRAQIIRGFAEFMQSEVQSLTDEEFEDFTLIFTKKINLAMHRKMNEAFLAKVAQAEDRMYHCRNSL